MWIALTTFIAFEMQQWIPPHGLSPFSNTACEVLSQGGTGTVQTTTRTNLMHHALLSGPCLLEPLEVILVLYFALLYLSWHHFEGLVGMFLQILLGTSSTQAYCIQW